VSELVKEVLGPRGGMREVMIGSPLSEYVTGVLAPLYGAAVSDPEAEAEIPFTDFQAYEDDAHDRDVDSPPLLSPALHPKRRPMSIGLSFAVEGTIDAILVCLTWSKYERGSQAGTWLRKPRVFTGKIPIEHDGATWLDSDGKPSAPEVAEISLHVLVKKSLGNVSLVSLFFVNRIKFIPSKPDDNPRTEHHIFQPQIRVASDPKTTIVPWMQGRIGADEDEELTMLYKNRPLLARGHLCSAIWKEIDPEGAFAGKLDFPDSKKSPPFNWTDGEQLPESERLKFSPAGVRTEFVPAYSIPSPSLDWSNTESGSGPRLTAAFLAETWEPEKIKEALQPIASKYKEWVESNEGKIVQLDSSERTVAERLNQQCKRVLERIMGGISLLTADADARLAFCFANKALDIQWRWAHGVGLEWRPFQMAFILMTIESIVNPSSLDRDVCDLLWVPTGGGKTEAYLAIAALTFGYRRRHSLAHSETRTSSGVSVITRYTLRLLTIQQFRRALSMITAAERLRVWGYGSGKVGWRPEACSIVNDFLWGSVPFKIGLWVGGDVTPNKLEDSWGGNQPLRGALSILRGLSGQGEPAQVLRCPACQAILAVPSTGFSSGTYQLHFTILVLRGSLPSSIFGSLPGRYGDISCEEVKMTNHLSPNYFTLTLELTTAKTIRPIDLDNFWGIIEKKLASAKLVSIRASRPGYFARWFLGAKGENEAYDFEIFCPNPACDLRTPWIGGAPSGSTFGTFSLLPKKPELPDGNLHIGINPAFLSGPNASDRIPIPALTVDDQIYRQVPTMVIATVDKFARPPFEPRAAAFFGNVGFHHPIWGYYRSHQYPPNEDPDGHPKKLPHEPAGNRVPVSRLASPDLILQDELHLIEGPLGSLVGFYEGAVDYLCQEQRDHKVKYLASTATVRRASQQIQSVFSRRLQIFPPHNLTSDDRFYVRELKDSSVHPLDDKNPGRLYLGIACPGRGPLTPLVRIWARLLQTAWTNRDHPDIDLFWTLTGYFNAIRELAGVRALYRQDIKERLRDIAGIDARPTPADRCQELSSVTDSVELPAVLDLLSKVYPAAEDSVLTTSMFGTGVDVPRIGLMVVHGQPKTTSSYIQSTGRVGRSKGGLVVTFLRATRPRDLNHYEFFVGYHRQLHRFVEPITVYPFSPGVIERAGGPVTVFMLRNKSLFTVRWYDSTSAVLMGANRTSAPEIIDVVTSLDNRATVQPGSQMMQRGSVRKRLEPKLDLWQNVAQRRGASLRYVEYAIATTPTQPVVLGDAQHIRFKLEVVYENAPQSLRDIEETLGFET